MSILVSQKILDSIREELSRSTESFLLISAFCKLSLVQYFDECIVNTGVEKKLVVRFRPNDIISKASDLAIYPYCKDNGWKLYFRVDLHAKTYVFDHLRCIVGSANATSSGMSIGGSGNYEMATACELSDKDVKDLDLLLRGAVEMNDEIYNLMLSSIENCTVSNTVIASWPEEITKMYVPDYSLLFTEDFPPCQHPAEASAEDLIFLNLFPGASFTEIKNAFQRCKCFQWILSLVMNSDSQEMYFGEITVTLHEILLNDPKPYRKDVKQLLSNLLSWIDDIAIDNLRVDRPNHSQRVRYINRGV